MFDRIPICLHLLTRKEIFLVNQREFITSVRRIICKKDYNKITEVVKPQPRDMFPCFVEQNKTKKQNTPPKNNPWHWESNIFCNDV